MKQIKSKNQKLKNSIKSNCAQLKGYMSARLGSQDKEDARTEKMKKRGGDAKPDTVLEGKTTAKSGLPKPSAYLSAEGLHNLKYYRYSGTDKSLLANLFLKRHWDWCTAALFPVWMAYVSCPPTLPSSRWFDGSPASSPSLSSSIHG